SVLNALAFQASRRGNYGQARSNLDQALLLWTELGTGGVMLGLTNLATIAKKQGDYATARATYENILEACGRSGDAPRMASAFHGWEESAKEEGDYPRAERYYLDSLSFFQKIDNRGEIASVQRDLASLSREQGDYAVAATAYGEALAMFRALGHRRGIARVLEYLACCAAGQGQPERALILAGAAAALREKLGTPLSAAERAELDQNLQPIRENLTSSERAGFWTRGRTTPLDEILEYALAT